MEENTPNIEKELVHVFELLESNLVDQALINATSHVSLGIKLANNVFTNLPTIEE